MLEIDILVAEKRSWHFLTKNCDFLFCLWISFSLLLLLFCFILFCLFGCFFCCYYYLSFNKGCLQRREDLTNIIESRKELTLSTFFISDVAMESNSLP